MVRSLRQLLEPAPERMRLRGNVPGTRAPRLADIGRAVRASRRDRGVAEPIPPDEPLVPDSSEPGTDDDLAVETALAEAATAEDGTSTTSIAVTNGVPQEEREPAGTRGRSR